MFSKKIFFQIKQKISLPMLILIAAGILNFHYVLRYCVNVPHRNEWDYLFVFSSEGSFLHSDQETRPVLPYMIAYLFYLINGWNISIQIIFNYLVYLADIVLLYRLIVKTAGEYRFLPFLFLPFFSDLNALNLMQTTALQFHLCVLFGLIAADIGFCKQPTYHNSLKFILFLSLSVLSMNLIFAAGILAGWMVMEACRRNIARLIGVFIFTSVVFQVIGGGLFFFSGKQIFHFAGILFSIALTGLDKETSLHLILILPVCITLIYTFYKRRLWKDSSAMLLYSILLAVFLSALNNGNNKDSYVFIHRATGIILFAVPVVFTLLRLVKPIFIYLCCLSLIGYSASFSAGYFKKEAAFRMQTLNCARSYYNGTGDGICPSVDEYRSAAFLDMAKQLNLSFTRN